MLPIIDGHNDVLLRLHEKKTVSPARDFIDGDGLGQMDLPRIRAGGMGGGFFAIFSPGSHETVPDDDEDLNPPYAGALSQRAADRSAKAMLDIRDAIFAGAKGAVTPCTTAAEMRAAMDARTLGFITHTSPTFPTSRIITTAGFVPSGRCGRGPMSLPPAFPSAFRDHRTRAAG